MTTPTRVYSNDLLTVEWRQELCVHCGYCTRGLPTVFNTEAKPWVNLAGAAADAVAMQVKDCPSGALQLGAR